MPLEELLTATGRNLVTRWVGDGLRPLTRCRPPRPLGARGGKRIRNYKNITKAWAHVSIKQCALAKAQPIQSLATTESVNVGGLETDSKRGQVEFSLTCPITLLRFRSDNGNSGG